MFEGMGVGVLLGPVPYVCPYFTFIVFYEEGGPGRVLGGVPGASHYFYFQAPTPFIVIELFFGVLELEGGSVLSFLGHEVTDDAYDGRGAAYEVLF